MYLPAMPVLAADLQASVSASQATLIAFFISFGTSQLVYGPVSDVFGRKPPLYFGLVVFAAASVGCAAGGAGATADASSGALGLNQLKRTPPASASTVNSAGGGGTSRRTRVARLDMAEPWTTDEIGRYFETLLGN